MGQTTAIIGDVHGVLTPLQALVGKLALSEGDHLVLVGDLVDKGPDPAGVVNYIRCLAKEAPFRVTLVEGNHEDRHRRYHINLVERPGIAQKMAQDAPELPELDAELIAADRAFLAGAVPFLRLDDWNVLIVHGGIPGDMTRFPATQEEADALRGKAAGAFRRILRTRFVRADTGAFVVYGAEQAGDPFWAEVYDGRFGHVVFGHQPFFNGPACFRHATGIDTGAVHGETLTALVLPGEGEAHFVSVPGIAYRERKHPVGPIAPAGSALRLQKRTGPARSKAGRD